MRAITQNVWRDDARVQRRPDRIETGKRKLAVDHRLMREAAARAAEFLRHARTQQAGLAELVPGGAVHDAVLMPTFDVRHELGFEKAARLLLKQHEVLGHPGGARQVQGFHDVLAERSSAGSGFVIGMLITDEPGLNRSSRRRDGSVRNDATHDNSPSMQYCTSGFALSGSSRLPIVTLIYGPSMKR